MIVCSFSTSVADLKGKHRTAENVLSALRKHPRLSAFDLSEMKWLRDTVSMLEASGHIVSDSTSVQFPWVRYTVKDTP